MQEDRYGEVFFIGQAFFKQFVYCADSVRQPHSCSARLRLVELDQLANVVPRFDAAAERLVQGAVITHQDTAAPQRLPTTPPGSAGLVGLFSWVRPRRSGQAGGTADACSANSVSLSRN